MTNTEMTYDEWYGEMPKSLHRLVKRTKVTPAEWQGLEYDHGVDNFDAIEAEIRAKTVDGRFDAYHGHSFTVGAW